MKPLKDNVSITLDEDIVQKIKEYSERDDRSFSQYINMVLRNHIKETENKGFKPFWEPAFGQVFLWVKSDKKEPTSIVGACIARRRTVLSF